MSVEVGWYVARLRHMSAAELVHRVRERLQLRTLEREQRHYEGRRTLHVESLSFCAAEGAVLPRLTWDAASIAEHATELLEGHWSALGFAWQFTSAPDIWRRAPDTGNLWPADYFARIAYRQGNPYGDVRVAWEPARLQQLVELAVLAQQPSHRLAAVALIERQIVSWVRTNPPYVGIHYISAMECALRLIAVCHAVDMIRPWIRHPRAVWRSVVRIVDSHARLIERRLSLHSSAANHTIAEATGLLYAGALFPEFESAHRWHATGADLLRAEIRRQVLPDGGGAEQAPAYLAQIADLATLAWLIDRSLGDALAQPVHYARRFLAELRGETAATVTWGDDDGGCALSRRWRPAASVAPSRRLRATFPHTGYTVLRSRARGRHQIGFDHGPIGLPPLHGHGHADALSVTWRSGERDLLIDPGTFTYTGDATWRRYFRGTSAHNTITVDGLDQSAQRGAFIWTPTVSGRLVKAGNDRCSILLATHDGFADRGVRHFRGIVYDHGDRLVVFDRIVGNGEHTVSQWWHLGDDVDIDGHVVRSRDGALVFTVESATEILRHRGSMEPIAGWRSTRYGVKRPNTCIEVRRHGSLPCSLTTVFIAGGRATPSLDDAEAAHLATLSNWIAAAS